MQSKRKQGICLITNPVLQNRISSFNNLASNDRNCRQPCNFVTFKGKQQPEDSNSSQEFKNQNDGSKGLDSSNTIFQIVPLDNGQPDQAMGPIEPICINMNMEQPNEPARNPREPFKFAGYAVAFVSSAFASLGSLCLKLLPVEDTLQEKAKACMIRGISMMLYFGFIVLYQGHSFNIERGEYLVNISRAVLGALSVFLYYSAVMYITLGEVSALVYSSPIWTCILSYFILKESLPISLPLAIPVFLVGIILLAHPDLMVDARDEVAAGFELPISNHSAKLCDIQPSSLEKLKNITSSFHNIHQLDEFTTLEDVEANLTEIYFQHRLLGIVAALISSVILSMVIVILKFRKKTSIATCSFYLGVAMFSMPIVVQMIIGFGAFPTSSIEWFLHFCIGFFASSCQYCFQWSLQFIPAGSFSVLRSIDVVTGFVLGAIFLNEVVLWTSVLGSVLIMTVIAIIMLNDYFEDAIKSMLFCCQSKAKHQVKLTKR